MKTSWIALWFEAPLQSWGGDSRFYRRETMDFPTKSGVLGLICCALGKGGEQKDFLKEFELLSQDCFAFKKESNQCFLSTMYDFQTVGNGYNAKDEWENLHIPKKANGEDAENGSKLVVRGYLQDMAFGVIIEVPNHLAELIKEGLINPFWDLYLGRKNCAPTDFIYRGTFEKENDAENILVDIAKAKDLGMVFKVVDGENYGEDRDVFTLRDVPLQFGENKKYSTRRVTKIPIQEGGPSQ